MVHTPAGARAHTRSRLTRVFVCSCPKAALASFQSTRWTRCCRREAHSSSTWIRWPTPVPSGAGVPSAALFLSLDFHPAAGFSPKARRNHLQDPPEVQSWRLTTSCCVPVRILWPWVSEMLTWSSFLTACLGATEKPLIVSTFLIGLGRL